MSNIYKLHSSIELYVQRKIKLLKDISITDSSKEYYTNKQRIKNIESIWIRTRIVPDIIDTNYITKLLYTYRLIRDI